MFLLVGTTAPQSQNLNHGYVVRLVVDVQGLVRLAQIQHQEIAHWVSQLDAGAFGQVGICFWKS